MPEYNFQFRGWQIPIAIVLVLGFVGIKMYLNVRTVDDGMRDAIRQELLKEYSGQGPRDVARMLSEAKEGMPTEEIQPVVQRDVEFSSIGARGKFGRPVVLVMAEITVDGGPPPDRQAVRYFRMERNLGGDWMVIGNSDSYSYFSALMP